MWAIATDQEGVNQEGDSCYIWYFIDGKQPSIPVFSEDETSRVQFSIGILKILLKRSTQKKKKEKIRNESQSVR